MWENATGISLETPGNGDFSVDFRGRLWYNKPMETITISKAEYEEFQALKQQNADLQQRVEFLMAQMRLARHKQFGFSSEKSEYDQLSLFDEAEVYADPKKPEPEITEVKAHYRKKAAENKERLPDDLPVEIVEHTIQEKERICPECGEVLRMIGKTQRDTLLIVPATAKIRREIAYTYACEHCEKTACNTPVVKANMPPAVIKGSIATPEAVAHVMTQKFVMGLPLYRQEQEWNRAGLPLSRQTMSNWLIKCAEEYLTPVYDRLKAQMVQHTVLHVDETTLQVLHEEGKKPQSKSYMWLYRTSGDVSSQIVLYDYRPDRKSEHPKAFLKDFHGYLHADGYSGYHCLPNTITVVGCWAHARRKFDEVLKGLSEKARSGSLADKAKRYCDRLFALETEYSGLTPEERFNRRQKESKPLMEQFFRWLRSLDASSKSAFGNAAGYVLGQRRYLEAYLLDGRLEISNNRAERSIKPFVIGRKNFLFANTARGAQASAVMYSLVETAKENGIKPYDYIVWLLKTAPGLQLCVHPELADRLTLEQFQLVGTAGV